MDCRKYDEKLKEAVRTAWLKEEPLRLDPDTEAHITSCSRCKARLSAVRALMGPGRPMTDLPENLGERVYTAIEGRLNARPKARVPVFAWPLAAAALFIIVLAGAFILAFGPQSNNTMVTVRFILTAPAATHVSVVGDFNGWDPEKNRLSDADGNGTWELDLTLPGDREYRYQFRINNDTWVPDPKAQINIDDGFGGVNSLLDI
jgi:hypothetical protein